MTTVVVVTKDFFMKHKHYDMIVAKAENMDLVVFCNGPHGSKWHVKDSNWPCFSDEFDYFLCLPQHKEACLHWLNGGEVEFAGDYKSQWFIYQADKDRAWSEESAFNSDDYEFRIKPKKEKRWVILQYDSQLGDWCIEDGTLYKTLDEAEDNRRYGQLAEIEVEV